MSRSPDRDTAESIARRVASLPAERQADAIAEACGGDVYLSRRVRRTLAALAAPGDATVAMDTTGPTGTPATTAPDGAMIALAEGATVGNFRLLRFVGRGGCGAVWLAEQERPVRRRVALKFALSERLDSPEIRLRFEAERQVLATLNHPNIAALLDAGELPDGRPWFAMEFVEGVPLVEHCDLERLDIAGRLRILQAIARAVQHAHEFQVVHRDLKPSNILVTADGVPKLLDFGIAKILDPGFAGPKALTSDGGDPFTPEYAAPEQLTGDPTTVRADIYALGVVLYELLTGALPHDIDSRRREDVRRLKLETDPLPPSQALVRLRAGRTEGAPLTVVTGGGKATRRLDPAPLEEVSRQRRTRPDRLRKRLRGDLDVITLKAMHREPARRYGSAAAFAEDLERHLDGLPVEARPDSGAYRLSRFLARYRRAVVTTIVGLVALVAVGLAAVLYLERRGALAEADAARLSASNAQLEARNSALRREATAVVYQRLRADEDESSREAFRANVDRSGRVVALERAERDYADFCRIDPERVDDWLELAQIRRNLATLAWNRQRSAHAGDRPASDRWLEAADAALAEASRRDAEPGSVRELAGLLARDRADRGLADRDPAGARRQLEDAERHLDAAVAANGGSAASARRNLATILTMRADLASQAGEADAVGPLRDRVEELHRANLADAEAAGDAEAADRTRRDLAAALNRQADAAVRAARPAEAERRYRESLAVLGMTGSGTIEPRTRADRALTALFLADLLLQPEFALETPPEARAPEYARLVSFAAREYAELAWLAPLDLEAVRNLVRLQQGWIDRLGDDDRLATLDLLRRVRIDPDRAVEATTGPAGLALRIGNAARTAEVLATRDPDLARIRLAEALVEADRALASDENDVSVRVEALLALAIAADPRLSEADAALGRLGQATELEATIAASRVRGATATALYQATSRLERARERLAP